MKIQTTVLALLIVAAGLAATPALAQSGASTLSADEYARRAAAGNLFEIETSQLVLDKSEDEGVRAFAAQMVTDHTAALERLRAAVRAANLTTMLPTALDPAQAATITKLENISGMKFNLDYMQLQINGHREALELNRSYAARGDNPVLRQFAAEMVPVIQNHLTMAQKVRVSPPKSPGPT